MENQPETKSQVTETPEERAARCFKEDEEAQQLARQKCFVEGFRERKQQRLAVLIKYQDFMQNLLTRPKKNKRFCAWFHESLNRVANTVFTDDDEEYAAVGKYGRVLFPIYIMEKAFTKKEINDIVVNIAQAFGAFDY
jgi:hypothetical protein